MDCFPPGQGQDRLVSEKHFFLLLFFFFSEKGMLPLLVAIAESYPDIGNHSLLIISFPGLTGMNFVFCGCGFFKSMS